MKQIHVTLIEPPRFAFPLNHASNVAIPPLGNAYIAASIEDAGHSGKSGRDSAIEEIAFDYSFILKITKKLNT